MLHLTNGDAAASLLRSSGLPGEVVVWADVLHEGPVTAVHGPEWRHARARYLSGAGYGTFEAILHGYDGWDGALSRYREHDELVLWFEHDLFDQLLLARHLHWLSTQGHARARVSLICIDRFPDIEPFHGLGQLSPNQIASLFPERQPVTRELLAAGADAWRAFTDPDPRSVQAIVVRGMPALPFMAGALLRHLEEFPAVEDGLSRTERAVLETLSAGAQSPATVFRALQRLEERVFMADAAFWRIVRDMARPPEPLVAIAIDREPPDRLPGGRIAPTTAGQRVLERLADAVSLRGIDRWLGGVHLTSDRVWRWDRERRELRPPGLT